MVMLSSLFLKLRAEFKVLLQLKIFHRTDLTGHHDRVANSLFGTYIHMHILFQQTRVNI